VAAPVRKTLVIRPGAALRGRPYKGEPYSSPIIVTFEARLFRAISEKQNLSNRHSN